MNTQIWLIFMKISKNAIQIKKEKFLTVFDDIIVDMHSKKNLIQ